MTEETLKELKNDLSTLKGKVYRLSHANTKAEKESIDLCIERLIKQMINKYELPNYDPGIKEECHITEYFIHDMEEIIRKQESQEE